MHGQEDVGERKVEGKGKLVIAMQCHMWQLECMIVKKVREDLDT